MLHYLLTLLGYDHTCSHAKGAHYCVMCGECHCGR
jgi:hypothetical protein